MAVVTAPVGSARLVTYTGTPNTIGAVAAPGSVIRVDHTTSTTLNIPDEDVTNWEIGSQLTVVQGAAGAVTVAAPGDATVTGGTLTTVDEGDMIHLVKTGSDEWHAAISTSDTIS